jgi:Holliday junction resolvase-like predicted endonuclease
VNTWKVILATMVIFGTGVVTGGLLVRHLEPARGRRVQRAGDMVRPAPPPSAGVMRFEFLRRMERELDLTPEQREPIDKVLKEGQERMRNLMETLEPRRREELRRTMEEFRASLTPEQQQRFDAVVKQQQQRAREQRKAALPREHAPFSPPPASPPTLTNLELGPSAKPPAP